MDGILRTAVSGKLSTYAAIILMFTYSLLLDRDFACTCKPQHNDCNLYLILPFFMIFLLILGTDGSFQRVCRFLCAFGCSQQRHNGSFWGSGLLQLFKAFLVGLLWVAFVHIDGDWYVCCKNDQSEEQAQLACKANENNLTHRDRVLITELKNESWVIGGYLLFSIIAVASIMPLLGIIFKKCCRKSSCCNRKVLYDKLILEEEENVLTAILRKSAKEKLTEEFEDKIGGRKWEECFDVADELIKTSRPTISGQKQQQRARAMENQELRIEEEDAEDDPLLAENPGSSDEQ